MLTRTEACRVAGTLSTLDRRIASGVVRTKREPRGRRHRIHVVMDEEPPNTSDTPQSELAAAQERIPGPEERVSFLQEQLEWERQRCAELFDSLNDGQNSIERDRRGPWHGPWRGFWWLKGCEACTGEMETVAVGPDITR